jgi:hypothetical protein
MAMSEANDPLVATPHATELRGEFLNAIALLPQNRLHKNASSRLAIQQALLVLGQSLSLRRADLKVDLLALGQSAPGQAAFLALNVGVGHQAAASNRVIRYCLFHGDGLSITTISVMLHSAAISVMLRSSAYNR